MFKFIHAADAHLDSPLRGLERYEGAPVKEIRVATRRACENLVALAIGEGVAFVLLAGDLYDGDWKDYNTGLFFVAQMRRLEETGIPVLLVSGNHDAASRITRALRPPPNVHIFPTDKAGSHRFEELGVAVHGRGFARRAVSENLAAAYPEAEAGVFNVGLLHTSLDGREGHDVYAPCSIDDLRAKRYQYWALGHVHQREVVSEDPWIVFPGNLQGRHIREPGAKGATLVTVDRGEVSAVEHRDLDVLRWARCEVDVAGAEDADAVLDLTAAAMRHELEAAAGRPVAARLVLGGVCAAHRELAARTEHWVQELRALASGLGGAGLWLEKVSFETRAPGDPTAAVVRDDALGGLLRFLDELAEDGAGQRSLAAGFEPLRRKLPPELLAGPDALDPTDPSTLAPLLEGVREMLIDRLIRVSPPSGDG